MNQTLKKQIENKVVLLIKAIDEKCWFYKEEDNFVVETREGIDIPSLSSKTFAVTIILNIKSHKLVIKLREETSFNPIEESIEIDKNNEVFKEIIKVLQTKYLPYEKNIFNIKTNKIIVKIDDEEYPIFLEKIEDIKKELINDETAVEAIPYMENYCEELIEKTKGLSTYHISSSVPLPYINDYMMIEIIKV